MLRLQHLALWPTTYVRDTLVLRIKLIGVTVWTQHLSFFPSFFVQVTLALVRLIYSDE